jgi:hypothetical protein
MRNKDIKLCEYCHKTIDLKKEKYVLLGTYDKKKPLAEPYFHFNCFYVWYNGKVKEKAQNEIKQATGKAMGMLKGMGMGNLFGGLQQEVQKFDLKKETEIEVPDYETESIKKKERKKDGRKIKMSKM